VGIVESKAASSAQFRGAETVVVGIGRSEIVTRDKSEGNMVVKELGLCGYGNSEGGGMEGMFV